MGGYGSGSQGSRPVSKTVVEACRSIDVNLWVRKGILKAGVHQMGVCEWKYRDGAESSIGLDVMTQDMSRPAVLLFYEHQVGGEPRQERYEVRLTTTVPRFGGIRWWFVCPLTRGLHSCERRVGKLYLPPRGRYFGCRHCHRLTYTSCQESRKDQSVYRHLARDMGLDFRTARRLMNDIGKRSREDF